ncbi:MAG: vitamin B12 dependent-methionine synthase activation domain-containing protein, partial [Kiritimatiellia bacterium]|nr:vitamin B12 dependent-methionine synthase activation domain-containing protein [Kiritimatiellia bacterium]
EDSGWFQPAAAYGWFPCRAEGETLQVEALDGRTVVMAFPRQPRPPHRSIPDFFRRDADVVGLFVVTLGPKVMEECERLRTSDRYRDYLLLHGLAVETTDALAEWIHAKMRAELGHPDAGLTLQDYIVQNYRGSRYGFGYPSCPDLSLNVPCCELVGAPEIGVELSETFMMIPEVTTSALVAHHPAAKYFNL